MDPLVRRLEDAPWTDTRPIRRVVDRNSKSIGECGPRDTDSRADKARNVWDRAGVTPPPRALPPRRRARWRARFEGRGVRRGAYRYWRSPRTWLGAHRRCRGRVKVCRLGQGADRLRKRQRAKRRAPQSDVGRNNASASASISARHASCCNHFSGRPEYP